MHPYMGPDQAGDPTKNITGVVALAQGIIDETNRPVIATELGQYCCPQPDGRCYEYPDSFDGRAMGYVEAVFNVLEQHAAGWTVWAWRPGSGGECGQPDVNTGDALFTPVDGQGADFAVLFPKYYSMAGGTFAPTAPTAPTGAPTTGSPAAPSSQPVSQPTTPAPTPLPTTAAPTAPTPPCQAEWQQCGGQGFAGVTTCCSATDACSVINAYYSQCVPVTPSPGSTPTTTSAPTKLPTHPPTKKPTSAPSSHSPTARPTKVPKTPKPTKPTKSTKSPTTHRPTTPRKPTRPKRRG